MANEWRSMCGEQGLSMLARFAATLMAFWMEVPGEA